MIGFSELLIIIVVALIIFFGGKKITELSRSAGRAVVEFKRGKMEAEKELQDLIGESKSDKDKKSS